MTDAVGLDFKHDSGPLGTYFMPQSMGSGCALFDFDGDGLIDIYLLHLGGPGGKRNQLFKQLPGGTFKDVSKGSGLDIDGFNHGVAIGDVNNDGKPDVLVTRYGGIKLFLNLGGGSFRDITDEAGLVNPLWSSSAAFLDYDRDGRLDLVVVNYLDYDPNTKCQDPHGLPDFCGPNQSRGRSSKLFRNLGPGQGTDGRALQVRFEDVSFASGIGRLAGPGLGVVCADFNGDAWPDLFVANDGKPNRLWINQKDGTFKDEAMSRGVAYTAMGNAYAGMGIAVGDVTGSGMLDLYVTHLGSETNTLWRQGPRGLFQDATAKAGLLRTRWRGTGFGTLFADFDLDGALDLAIVNGRVFRGGEARNTGLGFWETYAERNQLFANEGAGKFRDLSLANKPFCGHWNVGRGLACADFDNDGAPDLLVTSAGGRARLFRNVAPDRGNWLKVRALDPKLKRDAYGAEVRVRAGGRVWLRLINPAESYLSSSSPVALFGLGKTAQVESIQITWPDGTGERFPGGAVNCLVEVRKGEGRSP
ncbi:MAG: CRTAC1 family protein [Gemmataceae bacterium]|nr:CRTAC1 family protein [Gemmataceae bacterium]